MTDSHATYRRSLTPSLVTLIALWVVSLLAIYVLARSAVPHAVRLGTGAAPTLPLFPDEWLGVSVRVLAHTIAGIGFAHVMMGTRCPAWFPAAVVAGMTAVIWGFSAVCGLGHAEWASWLSGVTHLRGPSPLEASAAIASIGGALLGAVPHRAGYERAVRQARREVL